MAENSTVVMIRKLDPYASWERTQKEDGSKASRRGKVITTAGKRVTEAESAGVKGAKAKATANRMATEDTPRVNIDTKVDTTTTTAAPCMDTKAETTTTTAATR